MGGCPCVLSSLHLPGESLNPFTEYVCPKCGHFNPSARSVREARSKSGSPDAHARSPVSPPAAGFAPAQPQPQPPIAALHAGPNGAASSGAQLAPNGGTRQRHGRSDAVGADEASMSMDVDS